MAAVRFTLDPKGVADLLSGPEAATFLKNVGDHVASEWERLDPRSKPGGSEVPTIAVAMNRDARGSVARVFTMDHIWHIIEYGSVNNPPYRPATKAVENTGLRFEGA